MQTIAERATALLSAPGGGVYLYDAARGDVELAIATGSPVPTGTRLKMGEGMAGRVAQIHQGGRAALVPLCHASRQRRLQRPAV